MKQLIFSLFLFTAFAATAQDNELIAKSGDKGIYLEHKVSAKQSFYSIGRLYHLNPKFLASYNKLDISKGLQIDQKLRIPLIDSNFTQDRMNGTSVFYKVNDGEDLVAVSKKHNNVSVEKLRSWNSLTGNAVKKDKKIIIGFLSNEGIKSIAITNQPVTTKPVAKTEEKPVTTDPVLTKDEKKQEEKEAEAEEKAEKKQEKKDPPPVIKETRKPEVPGKGYFQSHFEQQIKKSPVSKDATVTSGIFKTTSGWQDAKYYLLIDAVQPGTIVKIINPTNNKAVYAKVLGEMSGIRQNDGLNIRISNAGAAALEITEQDKFIVKVNY
ncbi:hypothetical protein CAP36_03180 [Chitinophagaceae bacterium IBVUCB2]|nr:hypothetical protein CAP36_03180 [Chitinophagaceae bacterium IBVUCB2]